MAVPTPAGKVVRPGEEGPIAFRPRPLLHEQPKVRGSWILQAP
jgi:hypothetical protein